MSDMGQHSTDPVHYAAGAPLRRSRFAAWSVFLGMAGMTMAFQTYHAVTKGQMPWELAVLYGIGPLAIAIGVLEFASHWDWKPGQWGAYAVTAGSMYLSASATGTVTLHAAPTHAQLLFGALLDGSAILAIRYIFSGPRAGDAVAAVAQRESELLAQAAAERSAREQTEAAHRAEVSDLRATTRAEIEELSAARNTELSALRDELAEELGTARTARDDAEEALESARDDATRALARAEKLEAKLQALSDRQARKKRSASKPAADTGDALENETNRLRAAFEIRQDPTLLGPRMGGELARRLGVAASTGRRLLGEVTENGKLKPEYDSQPDPDRVSDSGER